MSDAVLQPRHTAESVRRELRGRAYQLGPGGAWETAERYLSGDVVGKLADARRWAALDPAFAENADALLAVQPAPVRLAAPGGEGLAVPFGAPWVPASVYLDFLAHLFPTYATSRSGIRLSYAPEVARWVLDADDPATIGSVENRKTWGTKRVTALELVEDGLRLRAPVVKDPVVTVGGESRQVRNEAETAAAQARLQEVREAWARWLPQDAARAALLESEYNARFNRWAPRRYDGSHLTFPRLAITYQGQPLRLRSHQAAGAQRIMERGDKDDTVLLSYFPGSGKSMCAIVGAVKRIQVGLSDRAVIVVPKHTLGQWRAFFYGFYPDLADWLLCATDDEFGDSARRRSFLVRAALSNAPVVLLTYEQFRSIPLRPETAAAYLRREVDELRAALVDGADDDGDCETDEEALEAGTAATSERRRVDQSEFKKREKKLADYQASCDARWTKVSAAGDADACWERWCADKRTLLVVDECFLYDTIVYTDRGPMKIGDIVEKRLPISVFTNMGRLRPVVRWLKRPLVAKMWVKIRHECGHLICTSEHKVHTEESGYIKAINLTSGHTLRHAENLRELWRPDAAGIEQKVKILQDQVPRLRQDAATDKDLRVLRDSIHGGEGEAEQAEQKKLQSCMRVVKPVHLEPGLGGAQVGVDARRSESHDREEVPRASRAHAPKKPDARSRNSGQGREDEYRQDVSGARGTTTHNGTATDASDCVRRRMGYGAPDRGEVAGPQSLLQDRHSGLGEEDCSRGRWSVSFDKKVEVFRQDEGGDAILSRVDFVEVLERGNIEVREHSQGSDYCYDLEVEEDHSYYADNVLVSNCHSFKNDNVVTAMNGVSGLPRGESNRAFDMRMKTHLLTAMELFPGVRVTPGKAVWLTGTPVTNSLAEAWIMMRHLQPRLLRRIGLWYFDAWAASFTTQLPSPEMDAIGNWRLKSRLKFHNVPELQKLLDECWDRVDPTTAEGSRPGIYGNRMRVVETPGSDDLRAYVGELAERADLIKRRLVDPTEDNMLKVTHDGRVASLFNGPPQSTWPTGRVTKLDAVAREVWDLYCHSDAMSGCQLVFCDLFTPREHSGSAAGAADLTDAELFLQQGIYGVLRDKVVAAGCLPGEVAYVHDASTDEERAALFADANAGRVRVLIGSTQRMGLGVNVQRRAYAAHHVTVPWRPDWLDQANKRVDRDGNLFGQDGGEPVHIVCYPTIGSYDVVLWQMIAQKSEFIAAINSGTYGGREADDIGDLQVDAATAMAVALGDLRVVEKVKLELELAVLQRRYKSWKNEHGAAVHELVSLPRQIAEKDREVDELRALRAHCDRHQLAGFEALLAPLMGAIDADGKPNTPAWERVKDRQRADARLAALSQSLRARAGDDGVLVGQYRGLDLALCRDERGAYAELRHGDGARVSCRLAVGGVGTFAGAESQLYAVEQQASRLQRLRDVQTARLETLRATATAWPHLGEALAKLARYDALCAEVATAGIVDRQSFKFD